MAIRYLRLALLLTALIPGAAFPCTVSQALHVHDVHPQGGSLPAGFAVWLQLDGPVWLSGDVHLEDEQGQLFALTEEGRWSNDDWTCSHKSAACCGPRVGPSHLAQSLNFPSVTKPHPLHGALLDYCLGGAATAWLGRENPYLTPA